MAVSAYPGKPSVHFVPIIDAESSDYSCIFTTMCFIAEQARKYFIGILLKFRHTKRQYCERYRLDIGKFSHR